jgi:hypothetical protein
MTPDPAIAWFAVALNAVIAACCWYLSRLDLPRRTDLPL